MPHLVIPLQVVDLWNAPGAGQAFSTEAEREAEAQRLVAEEAQRPFDLRQGPLLRVTLLQLGEEEYILLLYLETKRKNTG